MNRPSETRWWQHGHSSERDFIYVTTQNLSSEQLLALADEVGSEQSLLVCCAAFHGVTAAKAAERWPNHAEEDPEDGAGPLRVGPRRLQPERGQPADGGAGT